MAFNAAVHDRGTGYCAQTDAQPKSCRPDFRGPLPGVLTSRSALHYADAKQRFALANTMREETTRLETAWHQ